MDAQTKTILYFTGDLKRNIVTFFSLCYVKDKSRVKDVTFCFGKNVSVCSWVILT